MLFTKTNKRKLLQEQKVIKLGYNERSYKQISET